jgi:hypothetical protein
MKMHLRGNAISKEHSLQHGFLMGEFVESEFASVAAHSTVSNAAKG